MAKVVDVEGNPYRTERSPDHDEQLVRRLEDLLEQARSGRLIGLSYVGQGSNGLMQQGHAGRIEMSYRAVGAVRMLAKGIEDAVASVE